MIKSTSGISKLTVTYGYPELLVSKKSILVFSLISKVSDFLAIFGGDFWSDFWENFLDAAYTFQSCFNSASFSIEATMILFFQSTNKRPVRLFGTLEQEKLQSTNVIMLRYRARFFHCVGYETMYVCI